MFQVSRAVKRPIAMFVDQSDRDDPGVRRRGRQCLHRGRPEEERVRPILDMTISRFNAFAASSANSSRAKSALEARKIIDRAKGILMQVKGLSEEQAYALLRSTAMNKKRKITDVAQAVITAADLLR